MVDSEKPGFEEVVQLLSNSEKIESLNHIKDNESLTWHEYRRYLKDKGFVEEQGSKIVPTSYLVELLDARGQMVDEINALKGNQFNEWKPFQESLTTPKKAKVFYNLEQDTPLREFADNMEASSTHVSITVSDLIYEGLLENVSIRPKEKIVKYTELAKPLLEFRPFLHPQRNDVEVPEIQGYQEVTEESSVDTAEKYVEVLEQNIDTFEEFNSAVEESNKDSEILFLEVAHIRSNQIFYKGGRITKNKNGNGIEEGDYVLAEVNGSKNGIKVVNPLETYANISDFSDDYGISI